MSNFKQKIIKRKSRRILFMGLVIIMIAISIWFIISASFFLIKNLNNAFTQEPIIDQSNVSFDKEGFQKLNLIKER